MIRRLFSHTCKKDFVKETVLKDCVFLQPSSIVGREQNFLAGRENQGTPNTRHTYKNSTHPHSSTH